MLEVLVLASKTPPIPAPRTVLALVLTTAALAHPSRADSLILLGKGGPAGHASRARATASLAAETSQLLPCWRGDTPDVIKVAVTVNARGVVTAKAKTPGAAARCAAGVLGVATWSSGSPWTGVIEIHPVTATRDEVGIGLASQHWSLQACQQDDPAAKGRVVVHMRIHPDGRVTNARLETPLNSVVDRCLLSTASAMVLPPRRGGPVDYAVTVEFAGPRKPRAAPRPRH